MKLIENQKSGISIGLWQLIGFAAVSLLGTLLHFVYDWTGSTFAALFSGVNESTWEHTKLLFFPMFFFAIVQSFFVSDGYKNYWCIKLRGTLLGLALIPILFYTLNGIFGKTPDWINIAIFFVSAAIAYIYENGEFNKGGKDSKLSRLCFAALCIICVLYWIFTFITPEIPLFQDPIDMSFGI